MTRATHSPLFVAKELLETRYQGAAAVFLAGSVMRGEANLHSDIDLVVVYPRVETSYREWFHHRQWPIEAFVHDPETLRYFFYDVDRPVGRATLAEMVFEGLDVAGGSDLGEKLKIVAEQVLREGPPHLLDDQVEDLRYRLSSLADDIRDPRSRSDLLASGTLIYNELGNYFCRSRGSWTSAGKYMLRHMKKLDPVFARRFSEAFDVLFVSGRPERVIELAEEVMADRGGLNFESYKRMAPVQWRRTT